MPTAIAAEEQVRAALMALFQANAAGYLRAQGAATLRTGAFVPLTIGEPMVDTICVAYSGSRREPETWDLRDSEIMMTINIWGSGTNDVLAQQRAIAIQAALICCLDADEKECQSAGRDTYVNGALSAPPVVGHTRCLTSEDPKARHMIWHLAIPVLCPVRSARPEFAAVPPEDEE